MISYEIITDAAREFEYDYNYASVLDSWHQTPSAEDVEQEHVLITEINEVYRGRYESELSLDSAVISFVVLND